jgi:SAM-dependent methyltransferase
MARFYPVEYHDRRDHERGRARYARQLELLELSEDCVLDVGCASGDFLAHVLEARPGVRAVGVDAYSRGVRDARIEFHPRPLPECGLAAASFPLITAWAVFEHLHAPSRYFEEVARLLVPGGRFVFLVTNSESLFSRRAFREDVPRHTYHFSERALASYAERFGFRMTRCLYDDSVFDGRGKGTLRWLFARAAGVDWSDVRRGLAPAQRAAANVGRALDNLVFAAHWEALLRRSGTLVAEFRKPPRTPQLGG